MYHSRCFSWLPSKRRLEIRRALHIVARGPEPCMELSFQTRPLPGEKSVTWFPYKSFYWDACSLASLIAQLVKNLPAMQEIQVRFLGREDPREKKMVTPSSILAWRIPWIEEPGRLQSMGSHELDVT